MGSTAVWGLPYPDAADPPCDGAEAIQALADRLGEILNDWEADRAHLLRRPAALVSYESATGATQTLALAGQTNPVYNTTQIDTASMVDLARRADRLYITRPGQYVIGGQMTGVCSVNPLVDAKITMRCGSTQYLANSGGPGAHPPVQWLGTDGHRYGADAGGEPFRGAMQVYVPQTEIDGGRNWVELAWEHATASITITYADLYAFWLTD